MFTCERCGSGYNGNYIGVESCPRCLLLDRVQAPLSFKMFRIGESGAEPEQTGERKLPMPPAATDAEPASPQAARSAL